MLNEQSTIEILCDADKYTKYEHVQVGRDLFTIQDLIKKAALEGR